MSRHDISKRFGDSGYTKRTVATTASGGIGSTDRFKSDRKFELASERALPESGIASGKRFTVGKGGDTPYPDVITSAALRSRANSTITDSNNTKTAIADVDSRPRLWTEGERVIDPVSYSAWALGESAYAHSLYTRGAIHQADEKYQSKYANEFDTSIEVGEPTNIRDNVKNFAAKPQSPSRGTARASWGSIQSALQNRILPNELYEDDNGEYELTAYQVTIFMLAEGEIFGNKLSDVTKKIRTQKDIENIGGVIIAQTAGTDEFYIEDFEFTSIVGGPGVIANRFTFTIKSPFQADLVDHIFKASRLLQIRNHNDIPFFVLINWNARTTDTSAPKHFDTSRCFSFRIINSSLSYDDSGGAYEINAVRYEEHNFNTSYASLLEDITIEGHTVIEMMEQLLISIGSVYSKAVDNIIMPDVFRIDLDKEVAAWPMKKPKQADKSDVKSDTNRMTAAEKTVQNVLGGVSNTYVSAQFSAAAYPILKETSSYYFLHDKFLKTATYKKGHSIPAIMEDIINATEEMQKLATALKDPQGDDAQSKRSNPNTVERFHIKFDAEVELLGYDANKNQYACKRIYKIRKHLDPTLAKDEKVTAQTKPLSMARLSEILRLGLLQKAYPFYYSGLNTEVKGIDFKFDNHWINAVSMYSKMGGMAKRQHGMLADPIIASGFTSPAFDAARDQTARTVAIIESDIKKIDADIDANIGMGQGGGDLAAQKEAGKREHLQSERKKLTELIKKLEQKDGVTAAQVQAVKDGKLVVHTEGLDTYDKDGLIMATGNIYFTEVRPKFSGLVYMGDLSAEISEIEDSVMFPVPQIATVLPKKSTGMGEEYDRGNTILSEIVAKREGGDMVSIDVEIRGDPYWIPETFHKPNDDSISPAFQQPYLIIIASQTMDYNASGIFEINERSSLNAIYNVIRVQNRFSAGEFSQVLECKRDMTIDINAVLKAPEEFNKALTQYRADIVTADALRVANNNDAR